MVDAAWPRGDMPHSPFLDTRQAARYLGVSVRTLINWRARGIGPDCRWHGSRVFYHIDDLDKWSREQAERRVSSRA